MRLAQGHPEQRGRTDLAWTEDDRPLARAAPLPYFFAPASTVARSTRPPISPRWLAPLHTPA